MYLLVLRYHSSAERRLAGYVATDVTLPVSIFASFTGMTILILLTQTSFFLITDIREYVTIVGTILVDLKFDNQL